MRSRSAQYADESSHPKRPGSLLYIDEDDTEDSVCTKLEEQFSARRLTGFKLLASVKDYKSHIHTGAYRLSAEETTLQLFRKLNNGHQTPVRLVVPGVRTIGRMAATVGRQIMADSARIASLLNDSAYCASLGYSKETLPAFFLPNTYEVYWDMTAEDFVKRMKKEYARFWNRQRKDKAEAAGLTPVEVCTLASIVEEETANKSEMPVVAGLYLNRLRIGMPLQADPTVKFALQDFGLRRILHKHLETDSPYNTYKIQGLPPGPIRIASIHAIESVLNYAHHDYLYMCAKEDFSGTQFCAYARAASGQCPPIPAGTEQKEHPVGSFRLPDGFPELGEAGIRPVTYQHIVQRQLIVFRELVGNIPLHDRNAEAIQSHVAPDQ